jgi:hypothetical protein
MWSREEEAELGADSAESGKRGAESKVLRVGNMEQSVKRESRERSVERGSGRGSAKANGSELKS